MKINHSGAIDVIQAVIIAGLLGAIFITGTFVWKEYEYQKREGELAKIFSTVKFGDSEEEETVEGPSKDKVIDYTNIELPGTDLMKFESPELGLYFEYPASWGNARVRYVDDTMSIEEASPLVKSGKGVHIRFDRTGVNLVIASDDFSQFMMFPYNGDENLADGCSNLEYDSDKKYCESLVIAGQTTYGYFRRFNVECSGDDVRYSTFLNLPTDGYTGLRINMFISESELPIEETEEREDICGRNEDNIEANLQAIYTRENLSDDLSKKLEDFDVFLDSFKFLE